MQVLTGDWVGVASLRVDATLGVLDWEQRTTQAVDVEIAMRLDLQRSGEEDALDATINYAGVAEQVRFMLEKGRWRLLESLGLAVCRLLLYPPLDREMRAPVQEVAVRFAKPEVLSANPIPWVSMLWRRFSSRPPTPRRGAWTWRRVERGLRPKGSLCFDSRADCQATPWRRTKTARSTRRRPGSRT